jgi:hypothetical protein
VLFFTFLQKPLFVPFVPFSQMVAAKSRKVAFAMVFTLFYQNVNERRQLLNDEC